MKVHVYIPALNGGSRFREALAALQQQTYPVAQYVVIDSGSQDGTSEYAAAAGFRVIRIDKNDFDHGGTRQLGINTCPDADLYVFLTQDAIPASPDTVAAIVRYFDDPSVGMAYGRQLPHRGATAPETHARLFNYRAVPELRSMAAVPVYGIRTISCSNSFAAYRRSAFEQAGGFVRNTIMGEDVIMAGKMLLNGWYIAYAADACVYHSHNYTLRQEFERYFDIGVFHRANPWIFTSFGKADREGFRYVRSELSYVGKHQPLLLPKTVLSFIAKWLGYKAGLSYKKLPPRWRKAFSMYKGYWKK